MGMGDDGDGTNALLLSPPSAISPDRAWVTEELLPALAVFLEVRSDGRMASCRPCQDALNPFFEPFARH